MEKSAKFLGGERDIVKEWEGAREGAREGERERGTGFSCEPRELQIRPGVINQTY